MHSISEIYDIFRQHPVVSTDSRMVPAGAIFFSIRGDNFDGNRYAEKALEAGASLAVMDNAELAASLPESLSGRIILVSDTLKTLQALASHHREVLGIPILAITGSNGKTTTKELLSRVLSRKYRVTATRGNLNNHIGVPLTVLTMDSTTTFGIVEMGANHQHEIAELCRIAQPDYGLITNIGRAHLEGFGGPDGIVKGKGELFDYLLASGGTAFYLQDDPILSDMIKARQNSKAGGTYAPLRTVPYSTASFRLLPSGDTLSVDWQGRTIHTTLVGDYNLNNIAAAISVGTYFDVPATEIVTALQTYEPDNNRSQRKQTETNVLILDAYNANPSSMAAALDNFFKTETPPGYGKTVILGDMRELGEYAPDEHRRIISDLQERPDVEVLLVGIHFKTAASGTDFPAFDTVDGLREFIVAHPLHHRLMLIKGSRGEQLEKIVDLF